MELATNTFTKGLLMDTNPMIQGLDSLTDCLNGTLVTMNGNEIILLNDMGNRRVNNTFLPSGYEPVGIKEYGGIIYIAAYNPITHKSLIGSFPSPLRKIDSCSNYNNEGFTFNFLGATPINGIYFLEKDTLLFPLTNKDSIHAGDKFVIYNPEGNVFNPELFTNCDNVLGNKIKSPKNKKYTLSIGVLNSQNEFVDITKTLLRYDSSGDLIDTLNSSEIYKFNVGYFILCLKSENEINLTSADSLLILLRQKIEANTYSYKLIGPLYLKVKHNHIENFNYNIYASKDDEKLYLTVEADIEYNCPEKESSDEIVQDNNIDTYYSYLELEETSVSNGELDTPFFDFYVKNNNNNNYTDLSSSGILYSSRKKSVYNPKLNLYTITVVKKYEISLLEMQDVLYYCISPIAETVSNVKYHIKGLTTEASIDLSLLGTNTIKITDWQFYNSYNNNYTILKLGLTAYPGYNLKFSNLVLKFLEYSITGSNNTPQSYSIIYPNDDISIPVYNGIQRITLNWDSIGLQRNKIYLVKIFYNINTETRSISSSELFDGYILTSELFNEFYNGDIKNFCEVEESLTNTEEEVSFLNKMKYKYQVIDNPSIEIIDKKELAPSGSLISKTENIEYQIEKRYTVNILGDPKLQLYKAELYPDAFVPNPNSSLLSASNSSQNVDSLRFKVNNQIVPTSGALQRILSENISFTEGSSWEESLLGIESSNFGEFGDMIYHRGTKVWNKNKVTIEFSTLDKYKAVGTEITKVEGLFDTLYNVLYRSHKYTRFGGLAVHKELRGGNAGDRHWLRVISSMIPFPKNNHQNDCSSSDNDYIYKIDLIYNESKDVHGHKYCFYYEAWEDKILNALNGILAEVSNAEYHYDNSGVSGIGSFSEDAQYDQMFLFVFPQKNDDRQYRKNLSYTSRTGVKLDTNAYVWWRGKHGWHMFKSLFNYAESTTYSEVEVETSVSTLEIISNNNGSNNIIGGQTNEGIKPDRGLIDEVQFNDNQEENDLEENNEELPRRTLRVGLESAGYSTVDYSDSQASQVTGGTTNGSGLYTPGTPTSTPPSSSVTSVANGTYTYDIMKHLLNFLKNNLKHNYIYRVYDNYEGPTGYYSGKNTYKYNERYNIPLEISLNYTFNLGNSYNISLNDPKFNLNYFNFDGVILSEKFGKIWLKSSDFFQEKILKFDPNSTLNLYLRTGSFDLDPNQIYYIDNTTKLLTPLKNNLLLVDSEHKITKDRNNTELDSTHQMNTLIYNGNYDRGTPEYRYLTIWGSSGDGTTNLDLLNVKIVSDEL